MPIITGSTVTSFGKFSIESLSITNLNGFSALDFSADPSLFDLDVESKFVSGTINQSTLNFKLSVKDPESLVLTNVGQINSDSFSVIPFGTGVPVPLEIRLSILSTSKLT